jgi:ribonuclease T2
MNLRHFAAILALLWCYTTATQANDRSCSRAGKFDSHVLALTWQPAFCETNKRRAKECTTLKRSHYTARHFALHGLWPNQRGCGKNYGYCAKVRSKRPFCRYPRLPLRNDVRAAVERVMPNARFADGCLQRHEYWKHGSCRNRDPNDYFELAVGLTEQINRSAFVRDFLQQQVGKVVSRNRLLRAFDRSFGPGSAKRLQLVCRRGLLVEIRINLPRRLHLEADVAKLLPKARALKTKGRCPKRVTIDGV